MSRPAWGWRPRTLPLDSLPGTKGTKRFIPAPEYTVDCARCRSVFPAFSATVDATCPYCKFVTKRLRDKAISVPVDRRAHNGVIGMLSESERRGHDYFDGVTNMQWSAIHGLWLEALTAELPLIDMGDTVCTVRFEMVYFMSDVVKIDGKPAATNKVRFIRLRVKSTDGRLEFAERIEPYVSHRKTVQAMFLALCSVLVRVPDVGRPRLAM